MRTRDEDYGRRKEKNCSTLVAESRRQEEEAEREEEEKEEGEERKG